MQGKDIPVGGGQVTIKDISEKLNVSSVSVHRALTGKEGVSDKLRTKILQTAKELGYEMNYAASSLKRKVCRVAAILPQDNDLYFSYIWKGVEACAKEVRGLNVEVECLICENEAHQCELLKRIADHATQYSGVVTFSYTRMPQVLMQLQRLLALGISTVLIDDELKEPEGLYCIPSNEKVLGRVAAEFIGLITPEQGTVLVSRGRLDSKLHTNKAESFYKYLSGTKPDLKIHFIEGYYSAPDSDDIMYAEFCHALQEYPDTVACYALTSHENVPIAKAVKAMAADHKISVVGTDLNGTTSHLMRTGQLKAVINQGAYMKGYEGLRVLVDRVVKNIMPPLRIDCPIDVVLNSNLSFFEDSNKISTWRNSK